MKNLIKFISSMWLLIFLSSCGSQSTIAPALVQNLVDKGEFTFMAERANPTNYDVVNIMNSLPNGSSSRMLNLDADYTVEIRKDELNVTLPYFGRMYVSSMKGDNSLRFTSKDFKINRSTGSKGSSIFTIFPEDDKTVSRMVIEVFKNGKTYVAVQSNDRQPISYDGHIIANTVEKK